MAGVPVVPIAIRNSDVLMGKGTGEAQSGILEMIFLPPMPTQGLTTDEDINQLIEASRESIARELGVKFVNETRKSESL